jgi:tetratricopeptide (TPR) repeat protein
LPLTCRLLFGAWEFDGAGGLGVLCIIAGGYFRLMSRRPVRAAPDPASMLEGAIQLAQAGELEDAVARLTVAIRLNPRLWQAYQYRGELYFAQQRLGEAVSDFDAAIQLAPGERHLYLLRGRAHELLGDVLSAGRDFETAVALGGGEAAGSEPRP